MNAAPTGCLIFQDDRFLDHRTGGHPENPARLTSIHQHLKNRFPELLSSSSTEGFKPLRWNTSSLPLEPTTSEQHAISAVHTLDYLRQLELFAAHGGGNWDADTVVVPESWPIAQLAARTAMQATDQVMTGHTRTALCLLRPPGHHAVADNAMGFCLLNHVAIAARYAMQKYHLQRVLIIDWDVHHGNGTQDIFYEDAQVWFFSAHRHPFYPGTGLAAETGTGAGLGTTCNLPFSADVSRQEYLHAFTEQLTWFADRCQPELIFISAGFDAHQLDPIGSLGLESGDFRSLTRLVQQLANQYTGGKIVSLLEGGYHLQSLAESVGEHVQALSESVGMP